jgi:hypothetical protein
MPKPQNAQQAPDVATFDQVTRPSTTNDGLYASGLRFGEARVMAVGAAGAENKRPRRSVIEL